MHTSWEVPRCTHHGDGEEHAISMHRYSLSATGTFQQRMRSLHRGVIIPRMCSWEDEGEV